MAARAAAHARYRERGQGAARGVDEERAGSRAGRRSTFKHPCRVGESRAGQNRVTDLDDHIAGGRFVPVDEGEDGIRRVFGETVFAFVPDVDKLRRADVPDDAFWTVAEIERRWRNA